MNKYPLWKYILLIFIGLAALIVALPNLYGDKPAVQLAARSGVISENLAEEVRTSLNEGGFTDFEVYEEGVNLVISFPEEGQQLKAKDYMELKFGARHTVALNLVPATPDWLKSFSQPMYLGLDLRGGVHFLMEVDMESAIAQSLESYRPEWRSSLREQKIRYQGVQIKDGVINARFKDAAARDSALAALAPDYLDLVLTASDDGQFFFIEGVMSEQAIIDERKAALQQNIITLRNRVNELGVAEPVIQQQGTDRIVVQLPGVQDTNRAKRNTGRDSYTGISTDLWHCIRLVCGCRKWTRTGWCKVVQTAR